MSPWLISEFYAWLWLLSEKSESIDSSLGRLSLDVSDQIGFSHPETSGVRSTFKGQIGDDAKKSFSIGMLIHQLDVTVSVAPSGEGEPMNYWFRLSKGSIQSYKVKLPLSSAPESVESGVFENMVLLERAGSVLETLLRTFLSRRTDRAEEMFSDMKAYLFPPASQVDIEEAVAGEETAEEDEELPEEM